MVKKDFTFADLNRELNELYHYLKQEKYKDSEIKKLLQPFAPKSGLLDKTTTFFKFFALFVIALYLSSYSERVSWNLSAIGRVFLVKILPIWDWTYLANKKCLIDFNSIGDEAKEFNCGMCEYLDGLPVIPGNITNEDLQEKFLTIHRPVVLQGGLEEWTLTPDFIDDVLKDRVLFGSNPCDVLSSFDYKGLTFGGLLTKAKKLDNFFLHLQNCNVEAIRAMRKFSPRPSFLPGSLSPITYNWMLWHKNYNVTKFKPILLNEIYTLIVQVHGNTEFKLNPRRNCANQCKNLIFVLSAGQSFLMTDLWDLMYRPMSKGENIAIILETRLST